MNLQELHYDIKFKLDKVDSLTEKNFQDWELDWAINFTSDMLMKQRYGLTNLYRAGFESIQKRYDDLKTLQIKSPTNLQPAVLPVRQQGDLFEFQISDFAFPYYFLTRIHAEATKGNCTKTIRKLKVTQHDDLNNALENPFFDPDFNWGVALVTFGRTDQSGDSDGSIYLYTDGTFTIDKIYPEYLKQPNRVWIGTYDSLDGSNTVGDPVVECDLPEHLHTELSDQVVANISKIIEHPTFSQLKDSILQINE